MRRTSRTTTNRRPCRTARWLWAAGLCAIVAVIGAAPAGAQQADGGQVAMLAFFLDSVHTQPAGTGQIGFTFSRRQTPDGTEWMMPALHVVHGFTDNFDMSFSGAYSRGSYGDSFRMSGMGDSYLSAKLRVRDTEGGQLGVAFEPTLEILGEGSLSAGENGPGKHNWAFPVIVQKNLGGLHTFGEAGYITRGAVFGSVGVDTAVADDLGVGVNLLWSWATSGSLLNERLGLRRNRTDLLVGMYYVVDPSWTVLVSGGRTLSELDPNSTRSIVNVGVSYTFSGVRISRP